MARPPLAHSATRALTSFALALALLGPTLASPPAAGASCGACRVAEASCRRAVARLASACHDDCVEAVDRNGCRAECRVVRAESLGVCESDRGDCTAACDLGGSVCDASCRDGAGLCRRAARDTAGTCRRACSALSGADARRGCRAVCKTEEGNALHRCAGEASVCVGGCLPAPVCIASGWTGAALTACSAYCGGYACDRTAAGACGAARTQLHASSGEVAFPCDCQEAAAEDAAFASANPPPLPEPVATSVVALPPGVVPSAPLFHPDGQHLVFAFEDAQGTFLGVSELDGSDFQCVTCPLGSLPIEPEGVFPDASRVLLSNQITIGDTSDLPFPSPFAGSGAVPIVECSPSILQCDSVEVVLGRIPFDETDPSIAQMHREFRLAPDGAHIGWTQVRSDTGTVLVIGELRREASHYELDDVEILTDTGPRLVVDEAGRSVLTPNTAGELKQFERGGTHLTYIAGGGGLGFDVFELDIASGAVRRLTTHADYDETLHFSPDGAWFVVGSKRSADPARDVLEAFNLVPRPGFMALAGSDLWGLWAFQGNAQTNRGLDVWLLDEHGARGGYIGQNLSAGSGPCYKARGRNDWSPDGTRVLNHETLVQPVQPACAGESPGRIVVHHLISRVPLPPGGGIPAVPTPDALWAATDIEGFRPAPLPVGDFVVPGAVFGEARVGYTRTPGLETVSGTASVEYDDYSDDGLVVLNGHEAASPFAVFAENAYPADLSASGCYEGFLQSDASISGFPTFRGPLNGSAFGGFDGVQREICAPGVIGVDSCP